MKKLKYVLVSLVAVLAFMIVSFNITTTASAKTKYLTSYPKSMRGNWYMYTKHLGLTKVVIKKKSISEADHLEKGKAKYITYSIGKPLSKKYLNFLNNGNSKEPYLSKKHVRKMEVAFSSFQAHYTKLDNHKWVYCVVRYSQGGAVLNGYLNVRKVNHKPVLSYVRDSPGNSDDSHYGPIHFARTIKEAKKIKGKKFKKSFKYHNHYNNYNDPDSFVIV
ncbi:MAG: hypothetical protein M3Z82_08850 [Apilactobacillus sp.]|nr:hypothetical protein [Apilactobacillus sp.]